MLNWLLPNVQKLKNLTLWVVLIQIFLFLAAEWIYEGFAPTIRNVLAAYFFLLLLGLQVGGANIGELKLYSAMPFVLGFAVTYAILYAIGPGVTGNILLGQIENVKIAAGYGLLHGFVKAYIEEVIFRWVLPFKAGLGPILSNIGFGLFHVGVLAIQGTPLTGAIFVPVMILTGLGFAWHLLAWKVNIFGKPLGIMGSTGSHYAYNLFALGAI